MLPLDSVNMSIASDHAGFEYKEKLKELLEASGHKVNDFGTFSTEPVDYPDFIRPAAQAVATGQCELGIVVGGSGNGAAMVANRLTGIRCAVCWNAASARLARRHNDANMISLGQRMMGFDVARAIVETWLSTKFEAGRHRRRIAKIDQLPPAFKEEP